MNDQSTYDLPIQSEISPESSALKLDYQIREILCMPEYQMLRDEMIKTGELIQELDENELRTLTEEQLSVRKQCIKEATLLIRMIKESIYEGNGPMLNGRAKPQWFDLNGIRSLAKEIVLKLGKGNYTNITPENFMEIFNQNTVCSAKDLFLSLPKDTIDYQNEINRYLDNRAFCISVDEVETLEKQYTAMLEVFRSKQIEAESNRRKRRYIKAACGIVLLFIPAFIGLLTEALSFSSIVFCTGAELLCVLLLWLLG